MKRLWWKFRIALFALRWWRGLHLGTEVEYRGSRWTLVQGVQLPTWTLQSGDCRVNINESNFRKVKTLANYWHGVRSGYRFYCHSWLDIWERNGIHPWVRRLRIWGTP